MIKNIQNSFIICCLFLAAPLLVWGQGDNCNQAEPFCSNGGATFPAGVNNGTTQPAGNNYSCGGGIWSTLITQPNAAWYYLQISNAGNLEITLTNSNNLDVDFALWGPFANLTTAMGTCGSLPQAIDCSFNPQSTEVLNINGATVGQVYLLMITNYSNQATNITATQTNGTGATNCTIVTTCQANTGTVGVQVNGTNASNTVTLCDGDEISLTSNNNYTLPNNQTGETSELMYAIYNSAPPANPDLDPPGIDAGFSGVYWSSEDFNAANAGSLAQNIGGGLPQGMIDAGITGTNGTVWFVPVTVDDSDDNGDPNGVIQVDANGDNCYDTGTPISITFAGTPDISIASDCNPNNGNGSVDITVIGTGTFTITDTGAGNIGGSTVSGGGTFTISNLSGGQNWAFNLTQGTCVTSFGGTFTCGPDVCLIDAAITANPPASNYPNNQYPPNTVVTFCVDINQYNQSNINFLHGIVPVMGSGWTNVVSFQVPAVAANNEAGSYWSWMPGGSATHNNGTTSTVDDYPITQAGWWFHSVNTPAGTISPAPADPDNSWGDGCTEYCYNTTQAICNTTIYGEWNPGCGCSGSIFGELYVGAAGTAYDILDNSMTQAICLSQGGIWTNPAGPGGDLCVFLDGECYGNPTTGNGLQWTACWRATTKSAATCTTGDNLSVQIVTYADGQTGNWTDVGCTGDQPVPGPPASICCLAVPTETTPPSFCEGAAISLTATNPNTPASGTFDWYLDPSGGTPVGIGSPFNPGALNPGTYTYYVEINNNGCISNRTPVTFTVNPLPTITAANGNEVRCAGSATPVNLSVTLTNDTDNSASWTSNPAGFTATGNSINVSPAVTTTYIATASNANCGSVTFPIVVTVYTPTPPVVNNATLCGASTTLNAGAGYSNYSWSASGGGTISGASNVQTITVTSAGTYTVTVNDNGCTATDNAVVTAGAATPTITGPTTVCSGGSITLNAGAGYTNYAWSNSGGSGQSATFNNVTTNTTYVVTVTGAGGCTATDNHAVTVTATPTVTDPSNQTVCAGASTTAVNFSGTVGATFDWTNNTTSIGLAASGSGNIGAFTATNATTSPVTATVTVTPTISGCPGTAQTFTITVNPLPTVTDPSDQTLCAGASTTAVNFSGTAGATFNWTNNTPSIGLAASGSGNIGAFTATNATTSPVTATITVTPTLAGCPGTAQTFNITVNPLPTVTDPSNQTVCAGASTTAVNFSGTAGAAFNWTNNTPSIGLAASGSGNIGAFTAANATTSPVTATITVTPTLTGCTGTAQTFTITVNPLPTVTDPSDQTICAGASTTAVNFSGTAGATFNWTNNTPSIGLAASGSGNIGAFTATNATASPVTATITVTPSLAGCSGTPQTFSIIVNPQPTVTDPADQTVCEGANTTAINFSGTTGATFNWTNNNTAIGLGANGSGNIGAFTATNTGSTPIVATITVTPTLGTCNGTPQTFNITVNASNPVTLTPLSAVCASATSVPLNTTQSGITGNWSGTGVTGNSFSPAGLSGPITLTFAPNASQCADISTTTITVNPNPTFTITGSTSFCAGGNTTLSAPAGMTIYAWVASAGGTISGSTNGQSIIATTAGTYSATITNSNGCTASNSVAVTQAAALNPSISGGGTICANATPAVLNAGAGFTTYAWAASGGGTISGGTSSQTVNATTTGTYTVTVTQGACSGTGSTTLTVNPLPTVTDPADQSVCDNASTTAIVFSGTAGSTFDWTNNTPTIGLAASGSGNIAAFTAVNNGAAAVTAIVTVTPTLASCQGAPQTFTITVNPLPIANDPADQTVCAGASTSAINFSGTTGATFAWTNDTPSIGLAGSGSGNIGAFTATNATASPVTATITVTPSLAGCPGTPQTFTIIVNPSPTVTDPTDQTLCTGASTTAVNFSGTAGATFNWTNNTTSIGLAASGSGNIAAFTATNAGTSPVTATITVTPSLAGCSGTPQTFSIIVNPQPTVTDPADQTLCGGVSTAAVNFSGTAGATFAWTNDTPSIGLAASGSGNIGAFTAVNTGTSPITATITVTPTLGTCSGTPQTFTITVNPTPTVTDPTDQTLCAGASTTAVSFSGTTGATFNWLNNTPSIGLAANGSGNIGIFTALNAGTSPVTANITVTPTLGTCNGTPQAFNITVNPQPTLTDPADVTACAGVATSAISFSGTAGATFGWTNDNPAIGLAASGSGNIAAFTPTNAGSSPITATITVTPTLGTCNGTPQTFTITVNPTPTVNDPSDQTLCAGASATAISFSGSAGATFNWTNDTPSIGLAGSGSGNIPAFTATNTGAAPVTATITVTPVAGTCNGTPQTFTITVNPLVTPTLSVTPTTMCATNSPIALNTVQSGITGTWSGSGVTSNTFDPVGLSGSITLTFTANAGQCANNNTITVTVTAPTSVSLTPLSPICDIATPISLATTQSGITGTWSGTGVSGNSFDPSGQSGTVTLTFTPDPGQCRLASTVDITVNTALPVTLQSFTGLCSLDSPINLPTTQGGINGTWSGTGVSSNTFNPSGQSGSIVLTFTPSGTQCALPNTTTIAVNPASAAAPASIGDQCTTGGIIALGTNQGGLNGNWSGTGVSANNFNPSGLSGAIILTFTPNAGQCATAGTITINIITPPTAGNDANSTACDNASEGTSSIDLSTLTSVSGGAFAPIGGAPALTGTTFNGVGLSVGTSYQYSYTVTGTPPCTDGVATISITVNDCNLCPNLPVAGFSYSATSYCVGAGTTTPIMAVGATIGAFTASPSGLSINDTTGVINLATSTAGNYTVTNTIAAVPGGCPQATATFDISITDVPVANAGIDQSVCAGDNVTLIASGGSGGATYTWSVPASGASISFAPSGTSTYTVTVSNGGACTATDNVTVTVNPIPTPTAAANPTNICAGSGQTVSLIASPAGADAYQWSNGAGSGVSVSVTPSATTTYIVTVTDNNCSETAQVTVTVNQPPTAAAVASPAAICINSGDNVTLSATPVGAATYQWNNNAGSGSSVMVSPNATTSYSVTVSDANGCTDDAQVTVTVNNLPTVTAAAMDDNLCAGEGTVLTATGGNTYTWNNNAGSGSAVNVTPLSTTTYTVTVNDANACANTAQVTVTVNTPPNVTISGSSTFCPGGSTTLNVPTGYTSYQWTGGGNTNSITVSAANTYNVTVTDNNGCTATASQVVTQNSTLAVNIGGDTDICLGESSVLDAGAGFVSYQWTVSNGGAIQGANNGQTITATSGGTYTVSVSNGTCSGTGTLAVLTHPAPLAVINGANTICEGDGITLTASGGASYQWGNNLGSQDVIVDSPSNNTTYTVTVTDAFQCTNTANHSLTVTPMPIPNIIASDVDVCDGESVSLTASSGGSSFQWSGGAGNTANVTVTPSIPSSTYTVTVSNGNCSATGNITINVFPIPQAAVTASATDICENSGTLINLNATPAGANYQWSNGLGSTQNVSVSPNTNETYTVTVTGAGACSDVASVNVNVHPTPNVAIAGSSSFCPGGSANLSVPAGFSNYQWTGGGNSNNISVNTTNTYGVTVTDSNGCTASDELAVTQQNSLTINVSGGGAICQGTTTTLDAGGGGTGYQWTASNGGAIIGASNQQVINTNTAGTYTVTVTSTGCSGTGSAAVTVNPLPVPDIQGSSSMCTGNSNVLTVAGGPFAQYQWQDGSFANNFTVTSGGNYSVTVTNANGCTGSDTFVVTVNPNLNAGITGSLDFCQGQSTTLTATPAGMNYTWSNNSNGASLQVSTGGVYSVTVSDASGCSGSNQVLVNINTITDPVLNDQIICEGNSLTLNAGTYTSYQWSTNAATQSITVSPANNTFYSVTVTDSNGCTASDAANITVNQLPTVGISGSTTFCSGASTTLTATTGFDAYEWSNNAVTNSITVSAAGTYTVTVTDNGCTGTALVIVTQSSSLTPNVVGGGNICTGGTAILDAGVGFDTYSWSNTANTQTINVSTSGMFTVTVTQGTCSGTGSASVTVNPLPVPDIQGSSSICTGSSTSLTVAGGTFAQYQWQDGSFANSFTATTGGNYSVTVTNANGCTGSDTFTVAVNPNLNAGITGSLAFCQGENTTLTATPAGMSYTWSNGTNGASLQVSTGGTYSVTVSDASGCSGSAQVLVNVNNITAPVLNDQSICEGSSVTLNAGAYTSYDWSTTAITPSITVSPINSTTYSVTVTDGNGCTASDAANITVNPLPAVDISGSTTFCPGNNTTLTATAGFDSYQWSNNTATNSITVSAAGTYTVTATDNGCTGTASTTVTQSATLQPNVIGGGQLCAGSTATLDAGAGFDTYEWSNTATTQTIDVTLGSVYTVTVTQGACSGTGSTQVMMVPVPNPDIQGASSVCAGSTTVLSVANGPFAQYQWQDGSLTSTYTAGAGSYSVTVTEGPGCTASDTFDVTTTSQLVATIDGTNSFCSGTSTILTAQPTGAGLQYEWSNNQAGQTLSVSSGGDYSVTVTDSGGCSGSAVVTVVENTILSPVLNDAAICENESITLDAGAYTSYQWSTSAVQQSITETPLSNTTYSVTVTDSNGCTASDAANVTVNQLPVVGISGSTTFCPGSTTTLTATAGFDSYQWSNMELTNSITVSVAGTYAVTATDNGCMGTASVDVSQSATLQPNVVGSGGICAGETATLDAGAGFDTYAWSNTLNTQTIDVTTDGTFTVTVTQGACSGTGSASVTVNPLPQPDIQGNSPICNGTNTTLSVAGGIFTGYVWQDGSFNDTYVASAANTYSVTVTDGNSCTNSDTFDLSISPSLNVTINGNLSFCAGASTDLSASPSGAAFGYTWSNNANLPDVTISTFGTVSVTVTDASGCSGSASVLLSETAAPNAPNLQNATVCEGASVTIDAGAGYDTYEWTGGANTQSINLNPAVAGTYSVSVTLNGCSATADAVVTVIPSADAGADGASFVCNATADGNTTIDLSTLTSVTVGSFVALSGSPALTGSIFEGDGQTPGVYQYGYVVAAGGSCPSDTAYISITVNDCSVPLCPIVTEEADASLILCDGKVPDLAELEGLIGFSGNSATFAGFSWYSDAAMTNPVVPADYAYVGDNCTANSATFYVGMACTLTPGQLIPAGSVDFAIYPPFDSTLLVTTPGLCVPPTLTSTCPAYIITADDVPLVVNPGDSGIGVFSVVYTGDLGSDPCFNEPFEVAYSCPANCPESLFTAPDTLCTGESASFTFTGIAGATATYLWNFGTGASPATSTLANPTGVSWSSAGIKTVQLIVTENACSDTSTVNVAVSAVTASIDPASAILNSGGEITLTANGTSALNGDLSYLWSPVAGLSCTDCAAPVATPAGSTIYSVVISDEFGCNAQASANIVIERNNIVIVPNAFTPNQNVPNNVFKIHGQNVEQANLTIYNRWGNCVFEQTITDLSQGWDGSWKGRECEVGVYVYYINVRFNDGEEEFFKGNITLIR